MRFKVCGNMTDICVIQFNLLTMEYANTTRASAFTTSYGVALYLTSFLIIDVTFRTTHKFQKGRAILQEIFKATIFKAT